MSLSSQKSFTLIQNVQKASLERNLLKDNITLFMTFKDLPKVADLL